MEIRNAKDVTLEDILKEADNLYKECKLVWRGYKKITEIGDPAYVLPSAPKVPNLNSEDSKTLNDFYAKVQEKHRELAEAYPTVLRHMVQELFYKSDSFHKYLKYLEKHPWTSDATRLDSYTQYFRILYRDSNKKWNNKTLDLICKDYRARLQKEHDDFQDTYKKYETQIKKEEDK